MIKFPPFEELVKLTNDEIYELRNRLIEEVIESASNEEQKRKLKGLQFKIDMEVSRSKTPMASCIRISQMMHEKFSELRDALNGNIDEPSNKKINNNNLINFEKRLRKDD